MSFRDKQLSVPGLITVTGRQLKRYHIDQPERRIEPEVRQAAYQFLPRLLTAGDDTTPPSGWVVLHRGSDSGAYLLVYSWVWDNVVDVRIAAAGQPALDCPDDNPANFMELRRSWIGCVWELAVLEHERAAWVRHMLAPDQPDLDGYLIDTHDAGTVGH